jgi:hypothetical protein
MEAWILHFENGKNKKNYYSAWATEKQAEKAVAKYIKEDLRFEVPWPLYDAIQALIEADQTILAYQLVNVFSKDEERPNSNTRYYRFHFSIQKSTFLGSVFE